MARRPPAVLVVHGPNLDLLGVREPRLYGRTTLAQIDRLLADEAGRLGVTVTALQSNHEGVLIDRIHEARGKAAGLLINAGGLSHTSVALRDAVAAIGLPAVEVHLTNLAAREPFRQISLLAPVCVGTVAGFGAASYRLALHAVVGIISSRKGTR